MAKGGARPGSGRKKGSTTVPQFRNYVSNAERKKFVEFILATYMGDMRLAVWLGDQLFGKASQAHEVTGKDGAPIVFIRLTEPAPMTLTWSRNDWACRTGGGINPRIKGRTKGRA